MEAERVSLISQSLVLSSSPAAFKESPQSIGISTLTASLAPPLPSWPAPTHAPTSTADLLTGWLSPIFLPKLMPPVPLSSFPSARFCDFSRLLHRRVTCIWSPAFPRLLLLLLCCSPLSLQGDRPRLHTRQQAGRQAGRAQGRRRRVRWGRRMQRVVPLAAARCGAEACVPLDHVRSQMNHPLDAVAVTFQ